MMFVFFKTLKHLNLLCDLLYLIYYAKHLIPPPPLIPCLLFYIYIFIYIYCIYFIYFIPLLHPPLPSSPYHLHSRTNSKRDSGTSNIYPLPECHILNPTTLDPYLTLTNGAPYLTPNTLPPYLTPTISAPTPSKQTPPPPPPLSFGFVLFCPVLSQDPPRDPNVQSSFLPPPTLIPT